ncbi:membrane protein [Gordonia phage DirtyBoi]|nr:membrane protein [Gordonia phage DirtyBoi]
MFLELYSASVLTIMFLTALIVWVRDERRRRRERRSRTIGTVTTVDPSQVVRFPHGDVRSAERRARYLQSSAAVRR